MGIDHHRTADEYRRRIVLDGIEHHLALGPASPGGKADQQASLTTRLCTAALALGVTWPHGDSNVPSKSIAIIRYFAIPDLS